jgi:hypothetical protein
MHHRVSVNGNFAVRLGDADEVVRHRVERTSLFENPGNLLA